MDFGLAPTISIFVMIFFKCFFGDRKLLSLIRDTIFISINAWEQKLCHPKHNFYLTE